MTQSEFRGEVRLKAAIIDRLFDRAHIDDDAVLISEMTVANWSRRADVVLANGSLWAFEVKSELDSLTRLPGQLDAFTTHFEKVCVVCAPRFETGARALLPEGVGLWVAEDDGTLRERVRPRYTRLTKMAAVGLMKANELRRGSHKAGRRMTSTLVSGGLRSRTARGAGWAPRAPGITPPARSVGASIHQTAGSGDWC